MAVPYPKRSHATRGRLRRRLGRPSACALVNERLELFGQSPEDRDELLQQIAGVDQALDDGVEDLEALETPGGEDGERAEQLVEALSDEAQAIKPILGQLEQAVREDDAQALNEASQRLEEIDEREADRLARELAPTGAWSEPPSVPVMPRCVGPCALWCPPGERARPAPPAPS